MLPDAASPSPSELPEPESPPAAAAVESPEPPESLSSRGAAGAAVSGLAAAVVDVTRLAEGGGGVTLTAEAGDRGAVRGGDRRPGAVTGVGVGGGHAVARVRGPVRVRGSDDVTRVAGLARRPGGRRAVRRRPTRTAGGCGPVAVRAVVGAGAARRRRRRGGRVDGVTGLAGVTAVGVGVGVGVRVARGVASVTAVGGRGGGRVARVAGRRVAVGAGLGGTTRRRTPTGRP